MIILDKDSNVYLSIFTKNNCLYIKPFEKKIQKISNDVYLYSAVIDEYDCVHICFIDFKNYFYYYTYSKYCLNLVSSYNLNLTFKKICKLSIYLLNDSINIFFSKSLNKKYHNIYHLNYNFYRNEILEFSFKNAYKNKVIPYNINVSNNHIICCYYFKSKNTINSKYMVYNDYKKKWSTFSKIKTSQILFNYCNTIKY